MTRLTRRDFAHTVGMATSLASMARVAQAAPVTADDDRVVQMTGGGVGLRPAAYAALSERLTAGRDVEEDNYELICPSRHA
jgi:hypothetical protein